MAQKTNISPAKVGMNKSTHASQLDQQEYTYALNSNVEGSNGDTYSVTNEHSNVLASKFKDGYKVVGFKNDIKLDKTFFFLTNESTGISEFGEIVNKKTLPETLDNQSDCGGCENSNNLSLELENTIQVPHQEYKTLLSDCKDNKCFNLSVNHPIRKIEIKNEKNNSIIVFTDNFNPPRYIKLNSLEEYSFSGVEVCTDDSGVEQTCLACDKMKIFKDFEIPKLTPVSVMLGGRLRMGTYKFLIAYSDSSGNEISEYYSLTNNIRVFDENNTTLEQENLADITNYSIKLSVSDLDRNYTHYKIVVIQNTDINGAESYFEEGVHTINDTTVVYSGEENKKRISKTEIIQQNLYVKRWQGLTQSNGYLFGYGIEVEKEVNLQPVMNFVGEFMKWQSSIAPEDLYKDGVSTSNFLGYNRDEVVPYGIRFYGKNGYRTALFNLPARQPELKDNLEVSQTNLDRASIENSLGECISTDRNKRWHYYNDAVEEGNYFSRENSESPCGTEEIQTIEVVDYPQKICYKENIAQSGGGSILIEDVSTFTTLEDYIQENKDSCSLTPSPFGNSDLCQLLDISSYQEDYNTCLSGEQKLFGDNCEDVELVEDSREIQVVSESIEGENFVGIEKDFPADYSKLRKPEQCILYEIDYETGKPQMDVEFRFLHMYKGTRRGYYRILKRNYNFVNDSCQTSEPIQDIANGSESTQGYFNNYEGGLTISELQTNKIATCVPTNRWTDRIHKGALWFKGDTKGRKTFIFEVSSTKDIGDKDENVTNSINKNQDVRVSIFNKCNSATPIFCKVFSAKNSSLQCKVEIVPGGVKIQDGESAAQFFPEENLFPGDSFYVAVDNPIYNSAGVTEYVEDGDQNTKPLIPRFRTVPTDGCFSLATRSVEYTSAIVSWDKIIFRKKSVYTALCRYNQPVIQKCQAIPYKYGKFAYHESTETYPDNKELYDSSTLLIDVADIPEGTIREKFEDKFTTGVTQDGVYSLSESTNLVCKPIRHFRFPDNKVSPFMYEQRQSPFNQSVIHPLGVTIDEDILNMFLDIAVKNELITKERRDSLERYEIFRGDITSDRSIQASGLLYDVRKYTEDKEERFYPNYPFNDLGGDKLNLDANQSKIDKNNRFTFHSPETDYKKSALPSEMTVQGFMFGKSKGNIEEVKEHPKWVILTNKAKTLAGILSGLEVASEIAVKIAQSAEAWRFHAGWVWSANPVGIGLNVAVAALATAEGIVSSFGRYRYEWLKTFRDLGQPRNFASYYYAEGDYNYLLPLQDEGQMLRGLNISKKIKAKTLNIIDETTGEKIVFNNKDREESVFLSTGEYPITYKDEYKNYDNNKVDFNNSSLTFASESLQCKSGKSSDIIKNIASPYVALKNYKPAQYGTINSVKWISTGFVGNLTKANSSCVAIFGGDTFISRHTLKRKMPLFLTTAMKQASLTPFNYSFYNNIGERPRFYGDYELTDEFSKGSALFPDIDSKFNFDCYSKSGNYVKSPSKFYLSYYGVPSFLCETRINTNYRYGKTSLKDSFYPIVGDLGDWTQEDNVPLATANTFYYNDVYSKREFNYPVRTLGSNYSKFIYDTAYDRPNGVMYSLPDRDENNLNEPWTIYRPFDFYEFPTSYGKIVDLKGIEKNMVLARFEHQTAIYNSIDVTVDTGQKVENNSFGTGGIFLRPPVTFTETDLGHMGSQTTQMVSNEFGHFFADAKRGYVFKVNSAGQGKEEISAFSGGKPSGMAHWFKEQLPFKILKHVDNVDTDNALNGIGLTMGWDSKFKRVFLTKKDYVPVKKCKEINGVRPNVGDKDCILETGCIEFVEGLGFARNRSKCDEYNQTISCPEGFYYNSQTDECEKEIITSKCPKDFVYNSDTNKCESSIDIKPVCPVGYTFNEIAKLCLKTEKKSACPDGYTYNTETTKCEKEITKQACPIGYTYDSVEDKCKKRTISRACPQGYKYNNLTNKCETQETTSACGEGFSYNPSTGKCERPTEGCIPGLDLVVIIDATGSQGGSITAIKNSILTTIVPSIIARFGANYRLGLVAIKDRRTAGSRLFDIKQSMTIGNSAAFLSSLNTVIADGGGSDPEPSDMALEAVLNNTTERDFTGGYVGSDTIGEFRENVAKAVILITDTKPSGLDDTYGFEDWVHAKELSEQALSQDVKIFSYLTAGTPTAQAPVAPSGTTPPNTTYIMDNYASVTGGISYFTPGGVGLGEGVVNAIDNGVGCTQIEEPECLNGCPITQQGLCSCTVEIDSLCPEGCTTSTSGTCSCIKYIDKLCPESCEIIKVGGIDSNGICKCKDIVENLCEGWGVSEEGMCLIAIRLQPECPPGCVLTPEGMCRCENTVDPACTEGCEPISNQLCKCVERTPAIYDDSITPIKVTDKEHFREVGWTIAYSTLTGSWISYYDFIPNYYVNHNEYFQTGIETGIWSHLLTEKSFQVFYGKKYDFELEYPDKNVYVTRKLNSVNLWTEARRYHNEYDYAVNTEITFNRAIVYNNISNSGELNLIPQKNNIFFNRKYPKTNLDNTQDILISNKDNFEWSFDYIFNRTKSNLNNEPNWYWDVNQIKKEINPRAVSFKGKRLLESMRGDYFLINLKYNKDSRYKLIHKLSTQDYNI